MFTQPCFIRKNTPELREKLEKLGYKYSTIGGIKSNNIVVSLGCIFDIYPIDTIKRGFNNCVDCGTNEAMFLALATMRDDTDRYQWFVDDNTGIWERSENELPSRYMQMNGHKAAVKEIIEHFTMEGGAE